MIRIISALILAVAATLCSAAGQPIQLADNAPDRHIVVPGDTLWGISGKFLKDPWRWPEIWRLNKDQIKNPHRIYPGDVIVLEHDADGNPRLVLQTASRLQPRIHAEQINQAIPSIPSNIIEPFLSAPLVVDEAGMNDAARIVATQQDRVFIANGDLAYVANAKPEINMWQVYRKGRPMPDPETREVLGYEAYYLGTARQIEPGNPATFQIVTSKEEIGRGDRLLPSSRPPLIDYAPHRPEQNIDGRLISVYGGVGEGGRLSIVALNKGSNDGLEIGHVLSLQRNRVITQRDEDDRKESVQIPDERYGLVFVFRVFERISYALVVQAEGSVVVNDYARSPRAR